MQEAARRIAKIAIESKMPVVEGASLFFPLGAPRAGPSRTDSSPLRAHPLSLRRRVRRVVQARADGRRLLVVQRRQVLRHLQGALLLLPSETSRCLPNAESPSLASTQMTDVFEGSLIRVFRRLQELIRQMSMGALPSPHSSLSPAGRPTSADPRLALAPSLAAAKAIGSEELEEKFNAALACLERPSSVAFAASLVRRPSRSPFVSSCFGR